MSNTDPILQKLEEILRRGFLTLPGGNAMFVNQIRDEMRALLAEVAIEYGHGGLTRPYGVSREYWREVIRDRFGVEPEEQK